MSLKRNQNCNNRHSRLISKPQNHLCRSLWVQLDPTNSILYRIFIEKSRIWPTQKIILEKSFIWLISQEMDASLIWIFLCNKEFTVTKTQFIHTIFVTKLYRSGMYDMHLDKLMKSCWANIFIAYKTRVRSNFCHHRETKMENFDVIRNLGRGSFGQDRF